MSWQKIYSQNIRKVEELAGYLDLDQLGGSPFALNLPRRLAAKIEKGNRDDPILRQLIPLKEEEEVYVPGFTKDAVGDQEAKRAPRLLQKYKGRALLMTTSACAMNCRFCFRRHYENEESDFTEELELIRQDSSLFEVILSGGDPLSLSNSKLGALIHSLKAIDHLQFLRFHTRFPIGIPERIDEGFLALLEGRLRPIFVIHTNHPRELDMDVLESLERVRKAGAILLSQTVLLRGVNDDAETLIELFKTLSIHGVVPYYLHQLDRVEGCAHFEVPVEEGLSLIEKLREALPGYAVPRYVREIAGESSKTVL